MAFGDPSSDPNPGSAPLARQRPSWTGQRPAGLRPNLNRGLGATGGNWQGPNGQRPWQMRNSSGPTTGINSAPQSTGINSAPMMGNPNPPAIPPPPIINTPSTPSTLTTGVNSAPMFNSGAVAPAQTTGSVVPIQSATGGTDMGVIPPPQNTPYINPQMITSSPSEGITPSGPQTISSSPSEGITPSSGDVSTPIVPSGDLNGRLPDTGGPAPMPLNPFTPAAQQAIGGYDPNNPNQANLPPGLLNALQ